MLIQFYDRGSPQGKKFFATLDHLCQRLQVDRDPEYIQDLSRPISLGIQGKSILLINNEVAMVDKFPSDSELETLLQEYLDDDF